MERESFFSDRRWVREDMIAEAKRIIESAREKGVVLRLIGGLAARNHCNIINFCERDYSDIDLVGLGKQAKKISEVFQELGYKENFNVTLATAGRQMQFYKECNHADVHAHFFIHPEDHVDVFLDTFKMDHDIDLKHRLTIEDYTISVSDILLTKLQIYKINEKDVRDILTIVKDLPPGEEDKPGVINVKYIAELCSKDWGLYQDVMTNIDKCLNLMHYYNLTPEEVERIKSGLIKIKEAMENAPKIFKWKLRARIGEKKAWRRIVEDQRITTLDIKKELEKRKT